MQETPIKIRRIKSILDKKGVYEIVNSRCNRIIFVQPPADDDAYCALLDVCEAEPPPGLSASSIGVELDRPDVLELAIALLLIYSANITYAGDGNAT